MEENTKKSFQFKRVNSPTVNIHSLDESITKLGDIEVNPEAHIVITMPDNDASISVEFSQYRGEDGLMVWELFFKRKA